MDSLRGLASLAVLLGHTFAVFQWHSNFARWPLINNFFDGRSAVAMFFVLSGFVLTLGHVRDSQRPLSLIPFYARRITRIWLPWFAFFLFSLIARNYLWFPAPETLPPITNHHASFWSLDSSYSDVLKQMVFRLYDSRMVLLPQDWSLGVELQASILIPVFLLLMRKHWSFLLLIALALTWLGPSRGCYYASFAIGVLAAYVHAAPLKIFHGGLLVALGCILYQIRWVFESTALLPAFMGEREVWMLGSAGCGMIILGTLKSLRIRTLLEHPALAHLGRISYSLYLVQVIILVCLAPWIVFGLNSMGIRAELPLQILLIAAVTGVCLILADLGERWIEVPCIRLGKTVTRRLERHAAVTKLKI